jgi:hypothetical protein
VGQCHLESNVGTLLILHPTLRFEMKPERQVAMGDIYEYQIKGTNHSLGNYRLNHFCNIILDRFTKSDAVRHSAIPWFSFVHPRDSRKSTQQQNKVQVAFSCRHNVTNVEGSA